MIFAEEIEKIDNGFFLRMKESRYVPEDKRDLDGRCPELPYSLFVDSDYTDKDYYKQFPTIYHLRKWLIDTDDTPDIRLVYLAIHHLMKHRGHFLFSGNIENVKDFKYTFMQFISKLKDEEIDFYLQIDDEVLCLIEEILKNKNNTKSIKKTKLIKLLGAKTPCEKALLNLIAGGTVKLSDIFNDKDLDNCDKPKISFSDNSYDEDAAVIESVLGERYVIIEQAKTVYDWAVLADILGDYQSVSYAKVALYEKHQQDLIYLKRLVKENLGRDMYKKVFVTTDEKLNNYYAYIGTTKVNGKKRALISKKCSQKDFYDFLKKNIVKSISDNEVTKYLSEEIEKGTFLPRQVSKDNSVIP